MILFRAVFFLQADIVFWLGDLNYRIVEEVSDADVFEMVNKDDLEALRRVHELHKVRMIR